jgi:hypothetical protein
MTKLDKQGKGVILMHDLQKHTAVALPTLLRRLKAGGYKVVQMKAKEQLETLPEYDAMLVKDQKVPAVPADRSAAWCRRFRNKDWREAVTGSSLRNEKRALRIGIREARFALARLPVDAVPMQCGDNARPDARSACGAGRRLSASSQLCGPTLRQPGGALRATSVTLLHAGRPVLHPLAVARRGPACLGSGRLGPGRFSPWARRAAGRSTYFGASAACGTSAVRGPS